MLAEDPELCADLIDTGYVEFPDQVLDMESAEDWLADEFRVLEAAMKIPEVFQT
jgi:hypothetical protein